MHRVQSILTYCHILFNDGQELLPGCLSNADLLSIFCEVIIFIGGSRFCLKMKMAIRKHLQKNYATYGQINTLCSKLNEAQVWDWTLCINILSVQFHAVLHVQS